ncbi:MAG: glycogen synthase GlgA [Gammaproteobacteria bacterium SHHR-1]
MKEQLKVIFASSEAIPYMKTGGLADVSGSLPPVLRGLGQDVRLVIPAYPSALERIGHCWEVAHLRLPGHHEPIWLLEGRGQDDMPVYLVHAPQSFERAGNPYTGADGLDWPDNHRRFALFSRAVTAIALNHAGLDWQPDVVHGNDWQTGLIPALLNSEWQRPATVFTIHNLSYLGLFPRTAFDELLLPADLWRMEGLEFYGHASFLKAGLAYADRISAVSPTYAEEIRTPQFGYGLEGLLSYRAKYLRGIINGVDYRVWDPATDSALAGNFDADNPAPRLLNKQALQRHFGLPLRDDVMLLGYIGRLVEQKGIDLILSILQRLENKGGVQLVMLGSGNPELERGVRHAQWHYPRMFSCHIGYDESLAHLIEGGCDAFLMPSRFEPCGLNQLFSLRYGALPVVHATGGLADTVVDVSPESLAQGTATGFTFSHADPQGLWYALEKAINFYQKTPDTWRKIMRNGMTQDYSWRNSAEQYLQLYREAMEESPLPSVEGLKSEA